MNDKPVLRIRLSIVVVGGDQLVRATALNMKRQTFFNAPTDTKAIAGLKSKLAEIERRYLIRAEYPKTVEVEL